MNNRYLFLAVALSIGTSAYGMNETKLFPGMSADFMTRDGSNVVVSCNIPEQPQGDLRCIQESNQFFPVNKEGKRLSPDGLETLSACMNVIENIMDGVICGQKDFHFVLMDINSAQPLVNPQFGFLTLDECLTVVKTQKNNLIIVTQKNSGSIFTPGLDAMFLDRKSGKTSLSGSFSTFQRYGTTGQYSIKNMLLAIQGSSRQYLCYQNPHSESISLLGRSDSGFTVALSSFQNLNACYAELSKRISN